MFTLLKSKAGALFGTKVGIALVGALVVGGGGMAMAMTTTGGPASLFSNLAASRAAASPTAHDADSSSATKVAGQHSSASPEAGQDDHSGNAAICTRTAPVGQGEGEDQNKAECEGSVVSVNVSGKSFVLSTAHGNVTIHVDGKTQFAGGLSGLGGLKVGAKVKVAGNHQTNGTVLATQVKVDGAEPTHTPESGDGPEATHTPGPGGD